MKNFRVSRVALVILTLALFGGVGCGGNNNNNLPPPPPQIPNGPSFGGGGFVGGGSCGGVPGGIPFNSTGAPYIGILSGGYGYYGGQSQISLNLGFAQGFSGSYQSNFLVGSAQLNLPEISTTALCASSQDPQTGQAMYGQSYGGQISMTMAGVAQLPNPYFSSGYGYGGQQQFIQAPIYVTVEGVVYDNQFGGYVYVNVGGQVYQYSAGYGGGYY